MNNNLVPTAEEILTALGNDPFYPPASDAFKSLESYIVLLPEVAGEHLFELVSVGDFMSVEADFLTKILAEGFTDQIDDEDMRSLTNTLFGQLADQLRSIAGNIVNFLTTQGMTEHDMMLHPSLGLGEELSARYEAGILTFADVIRLQPGVFVPKPN